jgi:hypothetical protein
MQLKNHVRKQPTQAFHLEPDSVISKHERSGFDVEFSSLVIFRNRCSQTFWIKQKLENKNGIW